MPRGVLRFAGLSTAAKVRLLVVTMLLAWLACIAAPALVLSTLAADNVTNLQGAIAFVQTEAPEPLAVASPAETPEPESAAAERAMEVAPLAIPSDATSVERGRYLANQLSTCIGCHDKDFGGKHSRMREVEVADLYGALGTLPGDPRALLEGYLKDYRKFPARILQALDDLASLAPDMVVRFQGRPARIAEINFPLKIVKVKPEGGVPVPVPFGATGRFIETWMAL